VDALTFLSSYVVLSLVDLAIAIYVYGRARLRVVNQVFAFLGVTVGFWTLSIALAHNPSTSSVHSVRSTFAAASLMVLALLTLLYVFPSGSFPKSRVYFLLAAAGLSFFVLSYTSMLVRDRLEASAGLAVAYGPMYPVFGLYAVSCLVLGAALVRQNVKEARGRARVQLWYLIAGLLIPGIGIGITNLLIPLLFGASRYGQYGPIFTLIFLAVTAHALIRHRLMNVRLIISRSVSHLVAFLISGSLFVIAVSLAARPVIARFGLPTPADVALLFMLALLCQPVTRRLQRALDRYLYRVPYDYQGTIQDASRIMVSTLDLPSLLDHVCNVIGRALHPETVTVYLRYTGAEGYSRAARYQVGEDDGSQVPHMLPRESPLVAVFARHRGPLLRDDHRTDRDEEVRAAVEMASRLGGECVHPLFDERQLEGFFIVGPKLSGDPYFVEDLRLLTTVISQAAVAIKNAQLYRQVSLMESEKRRIERLAATTALAAGIAHEIKNPLVAIKTFAELLPERVSDPEFREDFARVMIREIERIDELIGRLGNLGTGPGHGLVPVDLREPVEEMLTLLSSRLEQTRVTAERSYEAEQPWISGDVAQLKQLFLNVFMNALESMPDGGRLTVRLARRWSSGRPMLFAEIRDTGSGITAELLDHVFDPFVTTEPRGSGLGLSICRGICDAHRAAIWAQNNPHGPGATIVMEFPAAQADGVNQSDAETRGDPQAT